MKGSVQRLNAIDAGRTVVNEMHDPGQLAWPVK
jgi:hypothetical protein